MAVEGAKQMAKQDQELVGYYLKDVTFSHPIPINLGDRMTEAQLYMRTNRDMVVKDSTSSEFRICVLQDVDWVETCHGTVEVQYKTLPNEVDGVQEQLRMLYHYRRCLDNALNTCKHTINTEYMYQHFRTIGLDYGSSFQALTALAWDGNSTVVGNIKTF